MLYNIIQNRYINNMLRIGRQNSTPDEQNRPFRDLSGNDYPRQNFTVGKSKVACAAAEIKIDALTLRVFYAACNYFLVHQKEDKEKFDSEGFIKYYTDYITPPKKGQSNTLTKKRIAAQLQRLSKMALYLPPVSDSEEIKRRTTEELAPSTIGQLDIAKLPESDKKTLNNKTLYDPESLSKTTGVDEIIRSFNFGENFKDYLSKVKTYIKVPIDLLQINTKHTPHAFTLLLNILIVADIRHRKSQSKHISTGKLLEYCPNLIMHKGRYHESVMDPIIDTLDKCSEPYFQSYFINQRDNKIEKPKKLTYRQWSNSRLKIERNPS